MQKTTSARGLSLRGSAFGPKIRVRKKKPPQPQPQPTGEVTPSLIPIISVDALVKELRTSLHAMFSSLDPNIPSTNLYDNCSQQAFRYFTTINTISPEAFHHKVNKLGLHASKKLCSELFRLVDQEDIGELTHATFVRRIFLPAGYFNFSKPPTPVNGVAMALQPQQQSSPRPLSARSRYSATSRTNSSPPVEPRSPLQRPTSPAASPRSSTPRGASGDPEDRANVHLAYEKCSLEEIERCISRKLEERTSRGTDRFRQAFRIFTKSEGITFADFHHQLSAKQILLSASKCRELFDRFDLDKNGTIELSEFTAALFRHEENEASLLRPGTPRAASHPASHTLRLEDFEVEVGSALPIQDILAKLREKLQQHTTKETDRFRQAFRIFSKSSGITPHEFNAAMAKLGLKLSDSQVRELFELFDFDKSGDLDLNEFVQGVMLDDNSTQHWYSIKDKRKVDESRQKLYSMAVQSVQSSWTIGEIEQMLREKIEQRTSRSSDCFRQAFRIFKKVNGIKPDEFHAALETIGLALHRSQSDQLFQRFDRDGSGDIDLDEFIHGVLPPDYTGRQWVAAADELHREAAQKRKEDAKRNPERFMTEVEMENWSLDEIEKRIRDKIQQATSKSSDTFRQAYKIFKKSNHVTMDEFRERLLALGFRLTQAQCEGLFKRYDTNNSDDIDLQEFCMKILPPDYTGDGDHWSHSEKFHKQRQQEKLEYVKRSKNGLLQLPKFEESRVRYTRGQHETRSFADLASEADELESNAPSVDMIHPASPPSRPTTPRGPSSSQQQHSHSHSHRPSSASSSYHSGGDPAEEASSPRVRQLQRPPTPKSSRPDVGSRPMSPRVSKVSQPGNNSPQPAVATPPTSPQRPMSPCQYVDRPSTPHRPMTPRGGTRQQQQQQYEREEGEEAEDILEDTEERDDEADERLTSHALRVLRARRVESANRHRRMREAEAPQRSTRHYGGAGTARYDRESVSGDSTTSFSSTVQRAVGTAKFTPARSNVLLLQRFMRVAAKRQSTTKAASSKQTVEDARRAKAKQRPPHTSRV